jgi:uncharacterized oxidoreductase
METATTVLVTGGSQGIGLGLAQRYRDAGARVLVTGRSAQALARATDALPGLETVVSDIGDADDRVRLAEHIARVMPQLDLVVNNAGIQRRVPLAADDADWATREEEIHILFSGPVHLNHLLIPHLLAHGRPATIVNTTSGGGFVPQPFAPVYSAVKAALHSYTMNLRHALADTTVRVTELIPPAVATNLSGLGDPHGTPVDTFVDAAFVGISANRDVVGYGPTDTDTFHARLDQETAAFTDALGRFDATTYAS